MWSSWACVTRRAFGGSVFKIEKSGVIRSTPKSESEGNMTPQSIRIFVFGVFMSRQFMPKTPVPPIEIILTYWDVKDVCGSSIGILKVDK